LEAIDIGYELANKTQKLQRSEIFIAKVLPNARKKRLSQKQNQVVEIA
jgi:hypothetical protein